MLSSVSSVQSFQINFLVMARTTTKKSTVTVSQCDGIAIKKGSQSDGTPLSSPRPLSINVERVDSTQDFRLPPLSGDGPAPLPGGGPSSQGAGSANQSSSVE